MRNPPRTARRFSYAHAAGLGLILIATGCGVGYLVWSRQYAPGRTHAESLTLLTHPIAVLPPHSHIVDADRADSLLDPGHGIFVNSDVYVAPRDMVITGISAVVDNAPPSVLHHVLLLRLNGHDASCPNRYEELYSVGADTPAGLSSTHYGILVKMGDRLLLSGMVHNPLPPEGPGGLYRNASIGLRLTLQDPKDGAVHAIEYHRLIISDARCEYPSSGSDVADTFTVPAHAKSFRLASASAATDNPSRFVFATSGVLVGIGGHMHPIEGGKRIDAYLNGRLIQTYLPSEDPLQSWVWRTNPTLPFFPIHVKKGDTLTFAVTYDNASAEPLRDAMGQLGFYFSPDPSRNASTK